MFRISKPLTQLTKNVSFLWNPSVETSFKEFKEALLTAPTLATLGVRKEIVVTRDAFKYAIGAILEQKHEDRFHSVAYASRTLDSAKLYYAAHENELLAIVETVLNWRAHLHDRTSITYTDHYPLKYLVTQKTLNVQMGVMAANHCCVRIYSNSTSRKVEYCCGPIIQTELPN